MRRFAFKQHAGFLLILLSCVLFGGNQSLTRHILLFLGLLYSFYIFFSFSASLQVRKFVLYPVFLFSMITLLFSLPWFSLSFDPLFSWNSIAHLLSCTGFFLLGLEMAADTPSVRRKRLTLLLLPLSILILVSWVQSILSPTHYFFLYPHSFQHPPYGFMGNNNLFSSIVNLVWFPMGALAIATFKYERGRDPGKAYVLSLTVVFLLIVLILSRSEGAWISFLIALGTYIFALHMRRSVKMMMFALTLILILGVCWLRVQEGGPDAFLKRITFYASTTGIVFEHPITGTGLGTFRLAAPHYQPPVEGMLLDKMHNDYLELLVTSGMLSFVLLIPAITMIRHGLYALRRGGLRAGLFLGMLAVCFHAVMDFPFQTISVPWIMALFAGTLFPDRNHRNGPPLLFFSMSTILLLLLAASQVLSFAAILSKGRYFPEFAPETVLKQLHKHNQAETEETYISHAERASTCHPRWAPLQAELARARWERDPAAAIRLVEEAARLEPFNVDIRLLAARYQFIEGNREQALYHVTQARAIKQTAPLIVPLTREEQDRVTIEGNQAYIRLYPRRSGEAYSVTVRQLKKRSSPRAWEIIREGLALHPDNPKLLDHAVGHLQKKNRRAACHFARLAFAAAPSGYRAYVCAKTTHALGLEAETRKWFLLSLQLHEHPSRLAANAMRYLSDPDEALTMMHTVFSRDPSAGLAYHLGIAFEKREEWERALTWFREAVNLKKDYSHAYRAMYRIEISRGNLLSASHILQRARQNMSESSVKKAFPEISREASSD